MFKKYFIGLIVLFTTLQGLIFFSTPEKAKAIPFPKQLDAPPKSIQVFQSTVSGKSDLCAATITWKAADTTLIENTLGAKKVDYYVTAQRPDNNEIKFALTTSNLRADTGSIPCDTEYIFSVATRYNGIKIAYNVSTPSPYRITNINFTSNKSTPGAVNCPPNVTATTFYTPNGTDGIGHVRFFIKPNYSTNICTSHYQTSPEDYLNSKKWTQYSFSYTSKTIESVTGSASTEPISFSKTTRYTVTAFDQLTGTKLGSTEILVQFISPTKIPTTTPANPAGTTTTGGTSGTSGTTGGTTTTGGTSGASGTTAGEAESICVKDCGGVAINKITDAGSQIRNAMCKMQCSTLEWFADIIKYMFVNILAQSIL